MGQKREFGCMLTPPQYRIWCDALGPCGEFYSDYLFQPNIKPKNNSNKFHLVRHSVGFGSALWATVVDQ